MKMINVLLIEDDENKRKRISEFLFEKFPSIRIKNAFSLHSGIKSVKSSSPDVVLLDMSLPNFDIGLEETGGAMHIFGGRELIRQMDRFNIDIPVIVITQFETFGKASNVIGLKELDAVLKAEHKNVYRGSVYYHASIGDWENQLKSLLEKIIETK